MNSLAAADTASSPQAPDASQPAPSVYVVVPAFNRCEKTLRFLQAFREVTYTNYRIIIVDDGSTDGTAQSVELGFPDVILLHGDGNLWWSGGTNMGVRCALDHGADYILTINDDGVMQPDFLSRMMAVAQQNPRYIVGCRLQCQDRPDEVWALGSTAVFRGGELFRLNFAGQSWERIGASVPNPYPVDCLPGNGVLLPRAVFERVGLYDAHGLPQYHADSDLVLRARRAGFEAVVATDAVVYNHILEKPLVDNRIDLILARKSDRYWRAVRTLTKRYAPWGRRTYLMARQYSPFFLNGPISRRVKRCLRFLLEPRPSTRAALPCAPSGRGYNPTCGSGPAGSRA